MKKALLSFIPMMLVACSTCKVAQMTPVKEIQYGSGGGYTGAVKTYSLKADGTLWEENKKIAKLSCDTLYSIYEYAELLPKENYVHPMNSYSFVRILTRDKTYYYVWSWSDKPPMEIINIYQKLIRQL